MGLDYTEQTNLYNNYWRKIESILPNKIISEFIRDFITMKQGIVPNKNKSVKIRHSTYTNFLNTLKKIMKKNYEHLLLCSGKISVGCCKQINKYHQKEKVN